MEINIKPTPYVNPTNIIDTDNINVNTPEKPTLYNDLSSMCTSIINSSKPTSNQTAQDYPFKPGYIFKGTIGVKGSGKTTKTYGFGKAADYTRKLDDNENIYFSNTTALNETLAKKKIESLQRLFDLSKGLA